MSLWVHAVLAIACSYAVALVTWPVLVRLPEKWISRLSLVTMPLVPYVGLVIAPAPTSYAARSARLVIVVLGCALGALSFLYWQRVKHFEFGDYARFLWVAMVNPQRLIFGHSGNSPGRWGE